MSKKILPVLVLTVLVLFCFFTPVPAAQAFENVEQGIKETS